MKLLVMMTISPHLLEIITFLIVLDVDDIDILSSDGLLDSPGTKFGPLLKKRENHNCATCVFYSSLDLSLYNLKNL